MFETIKKKIQQWKENRIALKKQQAKEEIARKKKLADERIHSRKDKGAVIGNRPEGISLTLFDKEFNSYISCIFITVGGRIFSKDRIKPGNRFKTKMSNGKTAIWSIMTKTKEHWKWDTCHNVKAIFVGWAA